MTEERIAKVGLECLTDETLAQIVEQSLSEYDGELKFQGLTAYNELERRTPQQ